MSARREWAKRQLLDFPAGAPSWCPRCQEHICTKHFWRDERGYLYFHNEGFPVFMWNATLRRWDDDLAELLKEK